MKKDKEGTHACLHLVQAVKVCAIRLSGGSVNCWDVLEDGGFKWGCVLDEFGGVAIIVSNEGEPQISQKNYLTVILSKKLSKRTASDHMKGGGNCDDDQIEIN